MKKFFKSLSLLLALVMIIGSLAACGKKEEGTPAATEEPKATEAAQTEEPAEEKADPAEATEVVILYPGEENDRFTEFLEETLNPKLREEAGIYVSMVYSPWEQYWEQKDIMLAANETIDLYWDGLPDLSTMVNKKQCQPLNDLINTYCQDMLKVFPQSQIDGGKVGDTIYGIPSCYAPSSAMFQLVCIREDLKKEVGMGDIKTPDDLKQYAELVVAAHPEIKGPADIIFKPLTRYFQEDAFAWVAYGDSVVFGENTEKAYDYYETEGFKETAKFNRSMYEAGLYKDELTTNYNERDSRMQQGVYIWVEGSLGKDTEIIDTVRANAPTAELKTYLLAPEEPKYVIAAGGEVLCVPYSAKNPEGAMKFLNWLYSSQENYLMAIYGEEGVDYEMVDGQIQALSSNEFFYEWMFRNANYQVFPVGTDPEYIAQYQAWDNNAVASKVIGFHFDNSAVKEQETAINEVANSDMLAIECGFVDFDENYDAAIAKLKAAGIDEYVAEVQRQIDEFLGK